MDDGGAAVVDWTVVDVAAAAPASVLGLVVLGSEFEVEVEVVEGVEEGSADEGGSEGWEDEGGGGGDCDVSGVGSVVGSVVVGSGGVEDGGGDGGALEDGGSAVVVGSGAEEDGGGEAEDEGGSEDESSEVPGVGRLSLESVEEGGGGRPVPAGVFCRRCMALFASGAEATELTTTASSRSRYILIAPHISKDG